jgi:hypothetical protein
MEEANRGSIFQGNVTGNFDSLFRVVRAIGWNEDLFNHELTSSFRGEEWGRKTFWLAHLMGS